MTRVVCDFLHDTFVTFLPVFYPFPSRVSQNLLKMLRDSQPKLTEGEVLIIQSVCPYVCPSIRPSVSQSSYM